MKIYFDIETIPTQNPAHQAYIVGNLKAPGNYKKPESIAEWIAENRTEVVKKTSLDGTFGEIAVISVAINDQPLVSFYRSDWQAPDREVDILTRFFAYLKEQGLKNTTIPEFIGHNIVNFDVRFIFQRAVINGVAPSYKANRKNTYDTMTEWAGYGNKDYVSLDKLCRVLDIPLKGSELDEEIDGSKVWQFVQDGKIEQVVRYCEADVERVRAVYKRMNFVE